MDVRDGNGRDGDLPGQAGSLWNLTAPSRPSFPRLGADTSVDVAIVGAGIVGLTTALLLKRAGRSVAVVEARRVGAQVTGNSTAKISSQHGLAYADLIDRHGMAKAQAYAKANQQAIEQIAAIVGDLGDACDFERKPSYAFSRTGKDIEAIREEGDAAARLGLPSVYVTEAPIGVPVAGALKFENQAQFHPRKYLDAMAAVIGGSASGQDGQGAVYEDTRALDVEDGEPCRVHTAAGVITAKDVVVATNLPFLDRGGFFSRAYPRAHIGIAAEIEPADAPDGMYLCIDDAPHSLRTWRHGDKTYLVVLSAGFTPGHTADVAGLFRQLQTSVQRDFPIGAVGYRWMTEDYDAMDGLPFVGKLTPLSRHVFTATGFGGWGITNGMAAASALTDSILGRANPAAGVYDATRVVPTGAVTFMRKNLHVGKQWFQGLVAPGEARSSDALAPGEGAIVAGKGGKVAAYKGEDGVVHHWSPYCPHLGCLLQWNNFERTWDCSCHGSRFDCGGRMLHGPATKDMQAQEKPPASPEEG